LPAESPLRDTLHDTGLRLTDQRQLLLELLETHGGHLDAHELYRLALEREPHLNLSTVYRTLGLLRDLGLVDEQHLGEDHHHYELKTAATHYHLVCSTCGAVVEFASPLVEQLKAAIGPEHDYVIADAQVNLVGTCATCRAAAVQQPAAAETAPGAARAGPGERMLGVLLGARRKVADGQAARSAPPARGEAPPAPTSLREVATGCSGRVAALTGGHELVARLAALGLTPGATLEVARNPGRGPVIVMVRDTRLVLGRGEAAHVLVQTKEA
jgi:Fur family transcriptional regulator, ferric uptake regulator